MSSSSLQLDTMHCKHCGEVIALLPRAAVVGRFSLRCLRCEVVLVIWPLQRRPASQRAIDDPLTISYTEDATAVVTEACTRRRMQ